MTKLTIITCDSCSKDLTTTSNCEDFRIAVVPERVPSAGGVVTLMAIEAPLKGKTHHFCGPACLYRWVGAMNEAQIKHMVERFLGWELPKDFNPDGGISVKRPNYAPNVHWAPVGTNLLDYTQAEAMVRYMVDGLPVKT